MTGFEPGSSGIVSDCSANWATTTSQHAEVIQIGAVCEDGQEFKCSIVPTGEIVPGASNVNWSPKARKTLPKWHSCGQCWNTKPRPASVLQLDQDYPEQPEGQWQNCLDDCSQCLQLWWLINNFVQHGVASITEIGRTITGFRDSLESFRKSFNYPHNTLGFLLLEFKIRQHQSHDALEDARDLKKLIEAACNKKNLSLYHFIPEFVYPRDIGR